MLSTQAVIKVADERREEKKAELIKVGMTGPWIDEPDRLEFNHMGFPCLMVRNSMSYAWCGYVGVPKGHPWYGEDYSEVIASAHGGLTYGAKCEGTICHVAEPGEPTDVFWLGFDCAHAFDLAPGMNVIDGVRLPTWPKAIYRGVDYVRKEVEGLASQAKAAS